MAWCCTPFFRNCQSLLCQYCTFKLAFPTYRVLAAGQPAYLRVTALRWYQVTMVTRYHGNTLQQAHSVLCVNQVTFCTVHPYIIGAAHHYCHRLRFTLIDDIVRLKNDCIIMRPSIKRPRYALHRPSVYPFVYLFHAHR